MEIMSQIELVKNKKYVNCKRVWLFSAYLLYCFSKYWKCLCWLWKICTHVSYASGLIYIHACIQVSVNFILNACVIAWSGVTEGRRRFWRWPAWANRRDAPTFSSLRLDATALPSQPLFLSNSKREFLECLSICHTCQVSYFVTK